MTASRLTSRKSRREGRKKGKGSTTGQAPTIISACLSWISSRSFSLPWWGLTPPRGQAPVDAINVDVSTLKRAPGIPQCAGVHAASETLRRFGACRRRRIDEGLHLNRHGGNLRRRPRDRDGSDQRRRSVPTEPTPDDP